MKKMVASKMIMIEMINVNGRYEDVYLKLKLSISYKFTGTSLRKTMSGLLDLKEYGLQNCRVRLVRNSHP